MNNLAVVPFGKRCPSCEETKSKSDFYPDKMTRSGCSSYCKKCTLEKKKKRRSDPEFVANRAKYEAARRLNPAITDYYTRAAFRANVKKRYGISFDDAVQMLNRQLGLCANRGCGKSLSFDVHGHASNRAVIDHCHKTGKVRGIMCRSCNAALGLIEKGGNIYLGLLDYLSRNPIPALKQRSKLMKD